MASTLFEIEQKQTYIHFHVILSEFVSQLRQLDS